MPRGLLAIERVNAHAQRFACERHTRPGAIAPTTQTTSPTTPHCRRLLPRWFATWAALPRGVTSPPPNGGSCAARAPLQVLPADNVATTRGELHHSRRDTPPTRRQNPPNAAKPPIQAWVRRGRRGELRPGVARITEHLGHHAHASHCSSRWSATWAPHTREQRPHHPRRDLTTPNRGLTAIKRGELHH